MCYLKRYKTKMPNSKRTLDSPVDLSKLAEMVSDEKVKGQLSRFSRIYPEINLWDFGMRVSGHLRVGDRVFILCGKKLYCCEIVGKINDPTGEIGDVLEWARLYGTPFKNVVLLKIAIAEELSSPETSKVKPAYISMDKIENDFYRVYDDEDVLEIIG